MQFFSAISGAPQLYMSLIALFNYLHSVLLFSKLLVGMRNNEKAFRMHINAGFFFLADISYRPTVQVSSGKIIFVTNVLAGGVK